MLSPRSICAYFPLCTPSLYRPETMEVPMDTTASFGAWLRRRRKALDLTQDELAQRVGCAPITIQKLEADARHPSHKLAERLVDQLAPTPDHRDVFIRCARGELTADHLPTPLTAPRAPIPDDPSCCRRSILPVPP